MKKFIGSFAIVAMACSFLWVGRAAAETEGTVTLSGEVLTVTELEVADANDANPGQSTSYTSLDLAAGESDTIVAYVHEKCNSQLGYKVTVESANATADANGYLYLKGAVAENPHKVAYTLEYDNVAVVLTAGAAEITSVEDPNANFPQFNSKPLSITIADNGDTAANSGAPADNYLAMLFADTYSDTLTFTIAANE
jgi:hypothetical protein